RASPSDVDRRHPLSGLQTGPGRRVRRGRARGRVVAGLLSLRITNERDVVLARQRARQVAALVGFDVQDQTRIATAVSEIARNAFEYARNGKVEFRREGTTSPQLLTVRITDEGPGITNLAAILGGRYHSETG